MAKIEYCMFHKESNERFDLGVGRWDILFPISTSGDRKEIKLGDIVSTVAQLVNRIHNDYKLRPDFEDVLDNEYVEIVAQDIWDWCNPPPAPPTFEVWTKDDFEQEFRNDMTIEEFLETYPYTGTRFYV